MRIFVISLARSGDRRRDIASQLAEHGLEFEFIDAVDGATLSMDELRSSVAPGRTRLKTDLARAGVVGCALSHRRAYERIAADRLPYALILEDDVKLLPGFKEALPLLEAAARQDEIHMLFLLANRSVALSRAGKVPLGPASGLYRAAHYTYLGGGQAYVMPLEAAKRMIEIQTPLKFVADEWPHFRTEGACRDYRIAFPFLVEHGEHGSEIGYSVTGIRRLLPLLQRFLPPLRAFRQRRHQQLVAERQVISFAED